MIIEGVVIVNEGVIGGDDRTWAPFKENILSEQVRQHVLQPHL